MALSPRNRVPLNGYVGPVTRWYHADPAVITNAAAQSKNVLFIALGSPYLTGIFLNIHINITLCSSLDSEANFDYHATKAARVDPLPAPPRT